MGEIHIKLPTLILLLAIVAGGSFAAGSALQSAPAPTAQATEPAEPEPVGEPAQPTEQQLPPGHPPLDDPMAQQQLLQPPSNADDASLEWKAPARWQVAPNASPMRIATYHVPRAAGDPADAELSIARAGGSPDANAQRWIGQFEDDGKRVSSRSSRKVGQLDVSIVEVQGTFSGGGMGGGGGQQAGWALLGAIVPVGSTAYFFKLTGPAKSVLAARSEFDSFIGSLTQKKGQGI